MSFFAFRKFKRNREELLPAFVKAAILNQLKTVFGTIGGNVELDLLNFDSKRQRFLLRVPLHSELKTKVAVTLISEFGDSSVIFQVNQALTQLPHLIPSVSL